MPRTDPLPENLIVWNDKAIMDAMGRTPEAAALLLAPQNLPIPSGMSVYQWSSRNKISHGWRAHIVYALLRARRIEPGQLFRKA